MHLIYSPDPAVGKIVIISDISCKIDNVSNGLMKK